MIAAREHVRGADLAALGAWHAYTRALELGADDEELDRLRLAVGRLEAERFAARDSLIKALEEHVAWLERERERAEVSAIIARVGEGLVTPAEQRAAFLAAMPEVAW